MERIEQLPKDDWTDTDLLTRDEAGERLDAEIAVVTRELTELEQQGNVDSHAVEVATKRLEVMRQVRAEMK